MPTRLSKCVKKRLIRPIYLMIRIRSGFKTFAFAMAYIGVMPHKSLKTDHKRYEINGLTLQSVLTCI